MIFIEEILNNILLNIYFEKYNNIDIVKLVSKKFYDLMLYIFNKYNIKENILIATNMKTYRPEVDQIEYVNNDFIIFDDFSFVNNWLHSSDNIENSSYHSYEPRVTKEILFIYNNRLIKGGQFVEYNYLDTTILVDLLNMNKLKFEEYIIYYFYIGCYYCYVIDFIILPYFDERILKKDKFLYYKKIKKNKFYNHNIRNINGIKY